MWIWIGIGGVAAYVLARSRERSWNFEGESRSGYHAGQPVQYELHETRVKGGIRLRIGVHALLLSPVLIWLAARWMRDSIVARIVLIEFIFFGTAGFVIGAGLLAVRGNSEMGSAPIHTSEVAIVSQEMTRGNRSSAYYLLFEPFAPGFTNPAKVKVDIDTYRIAVGGAQTNFELRWRVGAFGQPVVVEAPKPVR